MIVMKFGGAALATVEHIQAVARRIEKKRKTHKKILVVVSAMGEMTDELLDLARQIHPNPPARESDMLISVGERISMALLAMGLERLGIDAISLTGSQCGIITCEGHNDARICEVRPHRVCDALKRGSVVIVAGFQGVSREKEITTLGRGGSDTSAVALAIALGGDRVEFFKDVKGVFSKDPKAEPSAQFISELNYESALEVISSSTKKILHPRAINLAAKHHIHLHVLSFILKDDAELGTVISGKSHIKRGRCMYEV